MAWSTLAKTYRKNSSFFPFKGRLLFSINNQHGWWDSNLKSLSFSFTGAERPLIKADYPFQDDLSILAPKPLAFEYFLTVSHDARLSTSMRITTSHDPHVQLLTLYFPFTKRNPRKFLKLQKMLHSLWWLNLSKLDALLQVSCWKGNLKTNQVSYRLCCLRNLQSGKYHSVTDHVQQVNKPSWVSSTQSFTVVID